MKNQNTTLWERVGPEYFFWGAVLCALFLLISPVGGRPLSEGAEAAVIGAVESKAVVPFEEPVLVAKAAFVYDARDKRSLFEKNADEVLPLASITKVMTAATALSFIPETTFITINAEAVRMEGDSGLAVGEHWLLRDLLAFLLLESSNDATVAVSSAVGEIIATSSSGAMASRDRFVFEMNTLARDIGLVSTTFLNESGLDLDATQPGAMSTARETAYLLGYALDTFPAVFEETRRSERTFGTEEGRVYLAKNTNTGAHTLPLLLASKTGYTDLAGGNLVIAFDAGFGHPIIISVLGSTAEDRFADVEKLTWATLEALGQN